MVALQPRLRQQTAPPQPRTQTRGSRHLRNQGTPLAFGHRLGQTPAKEGKIAVQTRRTNLLNIEHLVGLRQLQGPNILGHHRRVKPGWAGHDAAEARDAVTVLRILLRQTQGWAVLAQDLIQSDQLHGRGSWKERMIFNNRVIGKMAC